jgi:heme/copper-type cytochrome/quinol oxidase subunit 3
MVVLAATMMLFGGQTLIEGLLTVRDPKAIVRLVGQTQVRTPLEEESQRKLEPIRDAIVERHRVALRIDAVVSIALGAFVLYAAAAALARDRNGRRLALLTAILGFVFYVASLFLWVRMAKETVDAAGPLLAEMAANAAHGAGRSSAQLGTAVVARPPLLAALGVGWSVLLVIYFGGRRGRELYGIARNP